MVNIIYGPKWFLGFDSIFELFSIIVLLLIALFGYKAYKLTSQKKYIFFSFAFLLIAISFMFKIISNIAVYYKTVEHNVYGIIQVSTYVVHQVRWINDLSIFMFRFLMLLGFMVILFTALEFKDKKLIFLFIFFLLISTIFSNFSYFVFHLTLVLILMVILNFYYKNHLKRRSRNSKLVTLAFFFIFLSQIISLFIVINNNLYFLSESVQLVGFLLLLYTYLLILRK